MMPKTIDTPFVREGSRQLVEVTFPHFRSVTDRPIYRSDQLASHVDRETYAREKYVMGRRTTSNEFQAQRATLT